MEVWKDIVGYEGLYLVSNQGRVFGVKRNNILKNGNGRYFHVVLCKGGITKEFSVHRLVATAFCQKKDGYTEVNHINENTHDNRAENLEWCTRTENIRHGTGIMRHAISQRNGKRNKAVKQFACDGEEIAEYRSIRDMQRTTGYDRSFVSRCARGERPSAYGYVWKFVD